ncbi:MAG: A24 family peptidase [Oscillospiraceae bacterium]|nr:A24 family peptidase [Oscillospiraceae bacterium]
MIVGFLVFASIYDTKHHKIPNFIHPIIIVFSFFAFDAHLMERVAGAFMGFLPLFIVSITTKKLGMGDAKLLMSFGFAIGVKCLFAAIIGLFVMVFTVGIYQAVKNKSLPVALAPFLSAGFIVVIFIERIV